MFRRFILISVAVSLQVYAAADESADKQVVLDGQLTNCYAVAGVSGVDNYPKAAGRTENQALFLLGDFETEQSAYEFQKDFVKQALPHLSDDYQANEKALAQVARQVLQDSNKQLTDKKYADPDSQYITLSLIHVVAQPRQWALFSVLGSVNEEARPANIYGAEKNYESYDPHKPLVNITVGYDPSLGEEQVCVDDSYYEGFVARGDLNAYADAMHEAGRRSLLAVDLAATLKILQQRQDELPDTPSAASSSSEEFQCSSATSSDDEDDHSCVDDSTTDDQDSADTAAQSNDWRCAVL